MTSELDLARIAKLQAETDLIAIQKQVEAEKLSAVIREVASMASEAKEARIYSFYGPVMAESVGRCIYELDNWSRRFPGEDITIVFNSPGGSVNEGFALFDFLLELKSRGHKIITKTLGMAASMGSILLQAGDERVIGPNSFIMLHEIHAGLQDMRTSELEDYTKLFARFEDKGLGILAERSTLSRQQIKNRWKRKDCWLDAEEALKFGFVDRIG
jgi:ATP-dependent Clp endopeptidase proteolytic subunit ClpP